MISDALGDLEKCVDTAGTQLDSLALKITDVEKNIEENDMDGLETGSVLELLESVTEVKNEYQNLRKDLQEVQQLQKEMTFSLRYQLQTMTQTFHILKKKIESNNLPITSLPQPSSSSKNKPNGESTTAVKTTKRNKN
uniref:Ska2 N-terminal domain-containing protein n=1 Tax=Culex tarsalis TaxID=7177 RepID=A0A1Q3FVN3_CULTA